MHLIINYACEQCDYKLSTENILPEHYIPIHQKSIHGGIQYLCEQCDFQAAWKDSLAMHCHSVHKRRTHSCQEFGQHSAINNQGPSRKKQEVKPWRDKISMRPM